MKEPLFYLLTALISHAEAQADKTRYHLFDPTPDALLRDLPPDRPDATESPITVDAGRFAPEASLFDYRRDDGIERHTCGSLNFKAGLTHNMDLQTVIDVRSGSQGDRDTFGNLTFRLKWNLYGNNYEIELLHTAVLGFSLTEKMGAYPEYIGILREDHYETDLAGGMSYEVNSNLLLDFGIQTRLNNDSEDFDFFTGFTKRF